MSDYRHDMHDIIEEEKKRERRDALLLSGVLFLVFLLFWALLF